MRLKKLILHGFKSFADRTEFVFDSPITGIVGPNGCGKSNVVDGFKWVLGEQSAKSLRGEAMMDVIFNGSGGRKPAGMAEVVLVFDNPRHHDGSRTLNLDVDEVAVSRRLFRDGASEYQVNNKSSRLKDIRELFLDTGIGVDAYSVIEQGRVAALLDANPEERRQIFEEAAGISKFKARKKEAQRKLEKVDQNLLRVTDIVDEVDKRLRSVKIQAGRARTYKEHHERLSELRLTHALHEYHTHHTHVGELSSQQEDAKFRLEDAGVDLARKQNELAEKRQEFEAITQKRQQLEYDLVQSGAALQSARQRQQYARQQLQQIADQIETYTADRAAADEKLAETSRNLGAETETLQRLTAELEEHRRLIDQRQQAYRDGQLQLNQANQQIEQHKAAILDLMRKLSSVNSRLGAIEIERRNIAGHQTRLADRRQVVLAELETLEKQRAESQAKLDETLEHIKSQQAQLESRREQASQLGRQIASVSEQLGSAKEHRSGLQSRQKLLKDLEAKREGVSEGVKSVLRQREQKFPFVRGLVADVLRVDVEHAHVIEAALDGRDQWLVTDSSAAALAASEALEDLEGRVNFIGAEFVDRTDGARHDRDTGVSPVPSMPNIEESQIAQSVNATHGRDARVTVEGYDWNQHPQRIRLAVDLVRVDPADAPLAGHLLGRTVVVDNLSDADELHRNGPAGWRFVTHTGEVLEADGTLRAGPLTAAMGLLSRRSELDALVQQLAEVEGRIETLTRQLTDGNAAAKELEQQQNALRNEVYRANTVKVEVSSKLSQNNDKQSALKREQPVLDRELQNLLEQTGRLKVEETALAEKKVAHEADQTSRQQQVEELTAAQKDRAEEIRHLAEQLTTSRVQLGQVQEKQLASQQQVQRMTGAKAELQQQVERLIRSIESASSKTAAVEAEIEQSAAAEQAALTQQEDLRQRIAAAGTQVADSGKLVQTLTGEVESLRAEHAEVEQALHALELRLGELKVRLETLVQRTIEELQLDLPAKYQSLSENGGEGYTPGEEVDWDAVAEEIRVLREKIQRLGNVNLDAISEQDELEKRAEFLSAQVLDLTGSKKQLEDLINEINTESSARFEQTFNAVREHFQEMFRKLFGGGKADIFLETEIPAPKNQQLPGIDGAEAPKMIKVDVLDAGIEIIARPPGKQPVSISQLSGGEKTMTCVALLMSIFKSKPSPFCILDEVDAALDEANNQRFNQIVQEFLELSQFIVITHSKRTMQIADVLYGVTMQEQGVSKRVAVKFDQVDSQGRINETAAA
ncbi:MAG TPA: AAA family ATPase [Tepidisphaeraceae bacterium]|jgi:chromosome segregation protein|nr:AAA family ATPase [Tepidisphaeraceae bacterium]